MRYKVEKWQRCDWWSRNYWRNVWGIYLVLSENLNWYVYEFIQPHKHPPRFWDPTYDQVYKILITKVRYNYIYLWNIYLVRVLGKWIQWSDAQPTSMGRVTQRISVQCSIGPLNFEKSIKIIWRRRITFKFAHLLQISLLFQEPNLWNFLQRLNPMSLMMHVHDKELRLIPQKIMVHWCLTIRIFCRYYSFYGCFS